MYNKLLHEIDCLKYLLLYSLSAAALYKTLPLEAKIDWPKRLTVDVIVLVDWFGENLPGSAIYALEEIFTKVKKIKYFIFTEKFDF